MVMTAVPNILSLLRIVLAFAFLHDNPFTRFVALVLAMITDGLDGYLARQFNSTSKIGTWLDPIADRFFVIFVVGIFFLEHRLVVWQFFALLARDVALSVFGCYLYSKDLLKGYRYRALWTGKLVTFLQFMVILALTLAYHVSDRVYLSFFFLGFFVFIEVILRDMFITTSTK